MLIEVSSRDLNCIAGLNIFFQQLLMPWMFLLSSHRRLVFLITNEHKKANFIWEDFLPMNSNCILLDALHGLYISPLLQV